MKKIHAPLSTLCAIFLIGCGAPATPPVKITPPVEPVAPAAAPGRIIFECDPPDAQVTVDGEARGTAAQISVQGGLTLPQGLHRFEISSPGFHPYRLELNLKAQTETIKIKLEADSQRP